MQQIYILVLVFLTGLASLVYQVVWQKYVSLFIGADSIAVSATLTVFFLCLALGYLAVGKFIKRYKTNRISIYCYLELAIGVYGVLSPGLFQVLTDFFPTTHSNFYHDLLFTSCFIGIPTALMGGTIPALTDGLSRSFERSHRIHAWVYGSNSFGAVFGTVFAGFFLIERLGLPMTLYLTAAINILVFVLGRSIAKSFESHQEVVPAPLSHEMPSTPAERSDRALVFCCFLISFLSGFYTFSFENLFIRVAGLSLGSSNYTYALIVAAFIASIAFGSYLASHFSNEKTPKVLFTVQLIAVGSLMTVFLSVPAWPTWIYGLRSVFYPSLFSLTFYHFATFGFFLSILILPVALLGMNLPLIFDSVKQRSTPLGETVGQIYFVNCLGCAGGAAVGGNILFQYFDLSGVFKFTLATVLLTLPLTAWLNGSRRFKSIGLASSCVLAGILALLPDWKVSDFVPSRHELPRPPAHANSSTDYLRSLIQNSRSQIVFSASDPLAEVAVDDQRFSRTLWINAGANANTVNDAATRALAALTPISLVPELKNAFIVGLGAGLSTSILSGVPGVQSIEVVELSRAVIDALEFFEAQNTHLKKNRQKVNIRLGDAYQILRATDRKFDLVIAEPSHLYVTGVEKLYTIEFLRAISSKLNQGGIHAQWFPLGPMTETTFLKIIKTFQTVYPYVTLWHAPNSTTMTIISSNDPLSLQVKNLSQRFQDLSGQLKLAKISSPQSLSLLQAASEGLVKAMSQIQNDVYEGEYPALAYESDRSRLASLVFDLDDFIRRQYFNLKIEPSENWQLVRERSRVRLDEVDYASIIRTNRHADLLDSSKQKIFWEAYNLFPGSFKDTFDSRRARYFRYFAGESDDAPANGSDADLARLIDLYRSAELVNPRCDRRRFFRLFPASCASTDCTIAKKLILETFALVPAGDLDFVSKETPEQARERVDELFGSATKGHKP